MSSHMAVTMKERPASMRRTKMHFWDGMGHTFMMPSITAKGTGIHSHPGSNCRDRQLQRVGETQHCSHLKGVTIWG